MQPGTRKLFNDWSSQLAEQWGGKLDRYDPTVIFQLVDLAIAVIAEKEWPLEHIKFCHDANHPGVIALGATKKDGMQPIWDHAYKVATIIQELTREDCEAYPATCKTGAVLCVKYGQELAKEREAESAGVDIDMDIEDWFDLGW